MNKNQKGAILPIIAILVVFGIGIVTFFLTKPTQSLNSNSDTAELTVTPITSDLPPLYPGVEWEEPVEDDLLFPDSEEGTKELKGFYLESSLFNNPNLSNEFFDYYESALAQRGWLFKELAGGGAYGEVHTYIKGNKYFVARSRAIPQTDREFQLIIMYSK